MSINQKNHHRNTVIVFAGLAVLAVLGVGFVIYLLISRSVYKVITDTAAKTPLVTVKQIGGCADSTENGCAKLTIYTSGDYLLTKSTSTKIARLDASERDKLSRLISEPADINQQTNTCEAEVDGIDTSYIILAEDTKESFSTCEYRRNRDSGIAKYKHYNAALLEFLTKILYSS